MQKPNKTSKSHSDFLRLEQQGPVAQITLARPEARNALSLEMLHALTDLFETLGQSEDARVIVIASDGPVFCSGHDLKELTQHRDDEDGGTAFFRTTMLACAAMMQAIVRCPKPVIAAVQGTATAAGCQLVATCDLAVASRGAHFCTPGVDIGLFCSTPMVALSRNLSRKHTMEMLLTGELVPATRAAELGLVNRVCDPEDLLMEAMKLAELIASKSTKVVAIGKEAFYRQLELPLSQAYDLTAEVMVKNMLHAHAQEGIGALLEKRDPDWSV